MFTVCGVCAVLTRPMTGSGLVLGEPSPLILNAGTPVHYGRERVGTVTRIDVDGELVRWTGQLEELELVLDWPAGELLPAVPLVEPSPLSLIRAGRLFGVADFLQGGETSTRGGHLLLTRWSVARVSLLCSRPWPEVELGVCEAPTAAGRVLPRRPDTASA